MDNHDNKEKRRPTRVELYDQPNKRSEKKTHFFFDKKADRTDKKEAAPTFKLDKQAKHSSQSNSDLNIQAQPTTNNSTRSSMNVQPISNDTRSSRSQERLSARNGQASAAKITGLGAKSGKNKQPKNKKPSHRPFKIALGILLAVLVVMVIVFAVKQQDPVTDNSSDTTVSTSSKSSRSPALRKSLPVLKRSTLLPARLMITTLTTRIHTTYQIPRPIRLQRQQSAHPAKLTARQPILIGTIVPITLATAAIMATIATLAATIATPAATTAVPATTVAQRLPARLLNPSAATPVALPRMAALNSQDFQISLDTIQIGAYNSN